MWRQVVAQSPNENAPQSEVLRYDIGWKALNTMLRSGRSLSGKERNCCFLNTKGQRFANISAAADLDFDDDGRVVAVCDWDHDGDLDFWIANRTGPQVRYLRNDAVNHHHFVTFRLEGVRCNRDAIGSRVVVQLQDGQKLTRTLRAGGGYLSQSSKWLHFGLGEQTEIDRVVVEWADGSTEELTNIQADKRYKVRQTQGRAVEWEPPTRKVNLAASKPPKPPKSDKSRIVLLSALPLPTIEYETRAGDLTALQYDGRPKLVNLWATWCAPCVEELTEWKDHADVLAGAGIDVITINVDEPVDDRQKQKQEILAALDRLGVTFEAGLGTIKLVNKFDVIQRSVLRMQQPLPIPSSFLIDGRGKLRVIYKGPVSSDQLLADVQLLEANSKQIIAASVPYPGKWLGTIVGSSPNSLVTRFVEGGFIDEAESYILQLMNTEVEVESYNPGEALVILGAIYIDQQRYADAANAFEQVLELDPSHRQSHIELAGVYLKLKQPLKAAEHFAAALERRQDDPELRFKYALALLEGGKADEAFAELETSLQLRPSPLAHHHMGNIAIAKGDTLAAVENYEAALALQPKFTGSANNLAWLLATHDDVLDAERAIQLVEDILSRPRTRIPGHLDTLAAGYAAAGKFEQAVRTAEEAVKLAKADGDTKKAQKIQKRLTLYRQDQAYKE